MAGIGWLLSSARLGAQDVTVTPPAWIDEHNIAGDQLPMPKHRPSLQYPDELRKSDEQGYALLVQSIDAKGKHSFFFEKGTNIYFQRVIERADEFVMRPAQKEGKPVDSISWFAVIFNPASAKTKGPEASPRLLAVAPVFVPGKLIDANDPSGALTLWATVKVNAKGETDGIALENPAGEKLLPAIRASLKQWRFAPARKAGAAIDGQLRVAFFVLPSPSPKLAEKMTPPRVIARKQPDYPIILRASRLRGEVLVEFVVSEEGKVEDATIARTTNPAFNEPALEAIRKWTFQPAMQNNKAVKAKLQQPVTFDLADTIAEDAYTVSTSRKSNDKLPPELRYDTPAKVRGVVVPVYPHDLRRAGTRGKATAVMSINEAGRVVRIDVVETTHPEFGQALTAALESFAFDPALKDGHPVVSFLRFEQSFNATELRDPEGDRLLTLEKKHPEKIASAKQLDAPLKAISRRAPVFPLIRAGRDDTAEAMVDLIVDDEGYVRLPRIVSATDPAFGYAAVQAVSQWRFEPPKVHGTPTAVRVRAPFAFTPAKTDDKAAAETK